MDLFKFLQTGAFVVDLHLRDPIVKVKEMLGSPEKIVGDDKVGFMFYSNGIRIGYFGDYIDALAINFIEKEGIEYPIELDEEEVIVVSEKTQLHSFIYILNQAGIKWRVNDQYNPFNFSIMTSANIYIIFDLLTGLISMITTGD